MRILTLITTANLVTAQEYVNNGNACTTGENYMLDKSMLVTFPLGASDDVAYPPTSNCKWTFNIPDEIVSAAINFIKIDIENSEDCGFDHLRVIGRTDGGDVEYQSERLCQEKNTVAPPIEFKATVRQIELLFTSDANIGKSGFSLLLRPIRNAGAEFDCDFNYDSICPGWTWSSEPQSVPWKPGFGSTMTQGTGPDQDYSKHGDRGYLYADASELLPQKSGDQPKWAYVATPLIDDPSDDGRDFCLEFYMHTFGDVNHIAPLTIVVASQGQSSIKLLTQVPSDPSKRQSSPAWKRVTVDFNKSNVGMLGESKFLFQFVVAQVQGARADLAIDAVRLHKSNCDRLCPSGAAEFTCDATASNLQCLPLDKICDGVNDCGNDRDEKGCEEGGGVVMPTAFTPTTAVPDLFFPTTMALMELGIFDTTAAAPVGFTTPPFNIDFPNEATPAFPFILDTTQSPDGFFDFFQTTGATPNDMFFETTPAINLFPDVLTTLSDDLPVFPTTPIPELPLVLTTENSLPSLKTTIIPTVMATTQMTDQTTTDESDDVVTTEKTNLRGTTTEPDLNNKMTTFVETTKQATTTTQQKEVSTLNSQTTLADIQTTVEAVETTNEPKVTSKASPMATEPIDAEEMTTTVEFTTTTTTTELTTVTTSVPTTMNLLETTLEATSTTPLIVPLTTMPFDMFETSVPPFPEFTTSSSTSSMATTPPQENTLQQKFVTVEPNSMSTIERQISQDGIEQIIQLETTIGHVLEFSIVRFNSQNPTCDDGNLSLFNGAIGTSSGTIVNICSDETTPLAELGHFFSTGHMAFIYTSAGDYLIEARSVPKEEVYNFQFCGGENIYNSTGMHIASPGFPAKYEIDQQCGYILRRPNQRSLLHIDFKSFNFDPEFRGKFRNGKTCQGGDSVIFSQLSGARAEMIGTGCGMRSPGDLTFVADIKLDFITDSMDSMKDSSGFFAHVYSEDCETKGMTTESCLCRQTCDDDQCQTEIMRLADGRELCKPGCACPPDKPVYDNGKCITREECRQAKPKPIEEKSVNVITSPSQITIQFDRIPTVEAYNIVLTEKTSEITDGSEAPVARRRVPELNMPNAPTRNSVTFEGLDPATEYEATIFTEIGDAKDAGDVVFSNPVRLTSKTNERNLVLPVEEETLIIEQLSNYICLVITKQRPDLDKIRVAINEKFPNQFSDLNREQRVIVPSIPVNGEIRACFSKLRAKTRYELKVVGIKDNTMSETLTLDVDTLEEDIEWKRRWYQWRYYSFNQWIKTFDQYQRVAQVRGIWTDPRQLADFACPVMLGKIPCKGATIDWRDLNQCAFSICENPPTFDELQSDNTLLDFQTMGAWEHEYDVYKKYLWPQWNRVLRRYVAVYSAKLNGGRATS